MCRVPPTKQISTPLLRDSTVDIQSQGSEQNFDVREVVYLYRLEELRRYRENKDADPLSFLSEVPQSAWSGNIFSGFETHHQQFPRRPEASHYTGIQVRNEIGN